MNLKVLQSKLGNIHYQKIYGYGSGYGAAIILVLFILLVIVIGTRAWGGNFNN